LDGVETLAAKQQQRFAELSTIKVASSNGRGKYILVVNQFQQGE
jgi:hypothetical protein